MIGLDSKTMASMPPTLAIVGGLALSMAGWVARHPCLVLSALLACSGALLALTATTIRLTTKDPR